MFVWAGGLKAPDIVMGSGLTVGHDGRVKVDQHLRALNHPEIYVAGDVASVVDPRSGHFLPPLAQIALEAETVARNLNAELEESRWRHSPSMTKGSSSPWAHGAAWPTSPASPPAADLLTFSRTPSSGSTANLSSTLGWDPLAV